MLFDEDDDIAWLARLALLALLAFREGENDCLATIVNLSTCQDARLSLVVDLGIISNMTLQ